MEEAMSGSCGESASSGFGSTVIDQDNHNHDHDHDQMVGNEIEGSDESELELGLGLGLGLVGSQSQNNNHQIPKFFTAKNNAKIGNSFNVGAGAKRAASPTGPSQVVGWPPIRAYRMNNMTNQAKSISTGEHSSKFYETKHKDVVHGTDGKGKTTPQGRVPVRSSLFVKVNMDGVAIGRKVDLNAHTGYESLAQTLEVMFIDGAAEKSHSNELKLMPKATRPSKLLDGSSDFLLTYEDKDGDWMLVGDVPWGMFLGTVKRLRIMRTSECNALATRLEERSTKQRSRPI